MASIDLHRNHGTMEPKVYGVSVETENEVARAALKSMGITIGTETEEQKEYAKSWQL
jgi:S-adenosylhomocysteine hydrolase